MLLTSPWWRLHEYRKSDGTVKLDHFSREFLGITLGEVRVCLIIKSRVQVAERVAEMMSHRVQVQVCA